MCVATRFISNQFSLTLPATLSASFMRKRVNGQMLQMWDTAGQEKYRAVSPLYYQKAFCVVLVFDLTNIYTFKGL